MEHRAPLADRVCDAQNQANITLHSARLLCLIDDLRIGEVDVHQEFGATPVAGDRRHQPFYAASGCCPERVIAAYQSSSGQFSKATMKSKVKVPWVAANRESTRDESHVVSEPSQPTEFEVQATIWHGLRELGIHARGEIKTKFAGRAQVRFDIAVFDSGKLIGIIEIKKSPIQHQTSWEGTRQGYRYSQFQVPLRIVYGMEQALELLRDAKDGRLWRDS
jgi:hypothetical protein